MKILELLRGTLVVITFQFTVLIIWTFVKRYESYIEVTDTILLIGDYRCRSGSVAYVVVEAFFEAVLICFGIYNVYTTWAFNSKTSQSKWALISLYNYGVCGILLLTLLSFLTHDEDWCIVVCSLSIFATTQSVLGYYIPALIESSQKASSKSSSDRDSNRSKNSTNSTVPGVMTKF